MRKLIIVMLILPLFLSLSYAVVVIPNNVINYMPVTLTNSQNTAVKANTPVNVLVDAGSIKSYLTGNLINAEWFFKNGTVATSWLEGNILNEANQLSNPNTSNTIKWWIKIPGTAFLPASGSNTIYLGFAGVKATSVNTFMDGATTGEAPNLSCTDMTACKTKGYAKLDNGYSVFSFYDNFNGVSLGSQWTQFTGSGATVTITVSNGVDIKSTASGTADMGIFASYTPPLNVIIDSMTKPINTASYYQIGLDKGMTSTSNTIQNGYAIIINAIFGTTGLFNYISGVSTSIGTGAVTSPQTANVYIVGMSWQNATTSKLYGYATNVFNQGSPPFIAKVSATDANTFTNVITHIVIAPGSGVGNEWTTYWIRGRAQPPANTMPSVSFATVNSAPGVTISAPTNSVVDVGQYQSVTATVTGGVPSYTYTFNAVNSVTVGTVVNGISFGSVAGTTQTWTYFVGSPSTSNSPIKDNVIVTDAAQAQTNSIYSSNFTINTAPSISSVTASNALADMLQYEALTATVSGGTDTGSGYTYNFYVTNAINGNVIANSLSTSTSTSKTFTFQIPQFTDKAANALGQPDVKLTITDTASTPFSTNQTNNPFTVSNILAPKLTESNTLLDSGQYQLLSAKAGPNSGSSITLPSGVINFLPVTLINKQNYAVATGTPVNVTLDAGKYQKYEAGNLINAEWFYANGTVIPSWLEGNQLNEANTLANLNTSNTITYWLKVNGPSFLPASSGNIVYLGWAGAKIGAANTLMDGATTGEAPNLSCTDMTACKTKGYAKLDNGYSVFSFYDNFNGVSLGSQWTQFTGSGATVTITVSNGVDIKSTAAGTADMGIFASYTPPLNVIIDSMTKPINAVSYYQIGLDKGMTSTSNTIQNGYAIITHGVFTLTYLQNYISGVATGISNAATSPVTANVYIVGMSWQNATTSKLYGYATNVFNQGSPPFIAKVSATDANTFTNVITHIVIAPVSAVNNEWTTYWIRGRQQPPANVMPKATFGNIGSATGPYSDAGTYPFTYNYFNVTGSSTLKKNTGVSATSNTYLFQVSSPTNSNTFTYNMIMTDSATTPFTNNSVSVSFTVNASLAASITPSSNAVYDQGTSIVFTGTATGGTGGFTYNFIVYNSVTNIQVGNYLSPSGQGRTLNYAFPVNSANSGNTLVANVFITDTATTPVTVNSILSGVFTVNSALASVILSASRTSASEGDTEVFTASWSGGTGPYTVNYFNVSGAVTLQQYSSVSPTSNTFTFTIHSTIPRKPLTYNVMITDSAATPTTANSTNLTIFASVLGGGGQPPVPPPTTVTTTIAPIVLPQFTFVQQPLYTATSYNVSSLTRLILQNTGTVAETITFNPPQQLLNIISLSSNSIFLKPNQTAGILVSFKPDASVPPGTYTIPLNITLSTAAGARLYQTEFLTATVFNSTNKPAVYNQLSLASNATAIGTIQISNPTNSSLNNVTLDTYVPGDAVRNISNIKISGIDGQVNASQGLYDIHWNVGSVMPKQTKYAYYTILGSQNPTLLTKVQSILAIYAATPNPNILRIVDLAVPILYTNSNSTINVSAIYTGTAPQQLTFAITAPSGITIQNPIQAFNAIPNQVITRHFNIQTGSSTGTYTLVLYASSSSVNFTYYLPAVILQNPGQQSSQTTSKPTTGPSNQQINPISYIVVAGYLAGAIIIILAIRQAFRFITNKGNARYKRDRADELRRIRKSIEAKDKETEEKEA